MVKGSYHPKAFLLHTKNVRRGLIARTKLAALLEGAVLTAKMLSQKSGLSYSAVLYHLHLMEKEHIVARQDKKPYIWRLTGAGQKRLIAI
ncbi:MAG: hypothetical protein NWF14_07975 [Candidatus Bathyarchaeota archaeon]|nr:hypothetical protein [Candidatus Bathyarchaeota archaeon]